MATTPPSHLLRWFQPAYWYLFQQILPVYRLQPTLFITSWWRDNWTNQRVGGDPHSQHLYGTAMDIDDANLCELEERLRRTDLIVVREQTHVHVQVYPAGYLEKLGFFSREAKRELLGIMDPG